MSPNKIRSLIGLILFFAVLPFAPLRGETPSAGENLHAQGALSFGNSTEKPYKIEDGDRAACRFTIERPFFSISVCSPSYSDSDGDLTLSLYRYDGDIARTLKSPALAQKKFVDFPDNGHLKLTFPAQEAGEYLWTLDTPRGEVGVWNDPQAASANAECYFNGKRIEGLFTFLLGIETSFPFSGSEEMLGLLLNRPAPVPEDPREERFVIEPDTWEAIDELGRALPDPESVQAPRDRQVGIFYWTWHDRDDYPGPYDVTKILAAHPEAADDPQHSAWGPFGARHHWGEPLLGYYTTLDPWIHRKHAQMLANAGVDVVVFDATNGTLTWMDSFLTLCRTYEQARADGVRTPKVAFMLPFWNTNYTLTDLRQLWRDIYRDGRYRDLWYFWDGRPLILGLPEAVDQAILSAEGEDLEELCAIRTFFTFRPVQPSYTAGPARPDQWCWLEVYPQNGYIPLSDGRFEMVGVGVAQNHSENRRSGGAGLAAMNDQDVFGRGYRVGSAEPITEDDVLRGRNVDQQWSRALELDPNFIFITGWNEWVAGRVTKWSGQPGAFPDEYNEPFSRDIEPERGLLMDDFYMQMVAKIRQYKGARKLRPAGGPVASLPAPGEDAWSAITPEYRDYRGDTLHRDAVGYGKIHYVDQTGRNDIIRAKAATDGDKLSFFVETAEPLTEPSDSEWMRLLISVGLDKNDEGNSWEHFDFTVEQTKDAAVLKRCLGGWNWETLAGAERRIDGSRMTVTIPLKALGIESAEIDLRFKWSDNISAPDDILDYYVTGDTAPDGRFVYRFRCR